MVASSRRARIASLRSRCVLLTFGAAAGATALFAMPSTYITGHPARFSRRSGGARAVMNP